MFFQSDNLYFFDTINKNKGYTTKTGKMTSKPIEGSEISKKIDSVWNAVHDEVNNKDINKLFAIWNPKANSIPLSIIVKIPKKNPVPI